MLSMHNSTYDGTFIVFEGGEGSGKSTQIKLLEDKLSDSTVYTKEPGGTDTADKIRSLLLDGDASMSPKTELALFCGARADHVEKVIEPTLEAGNTVVCDRFDLSTFAYQIHGRQQLEYNEFLTDINDYVVGDCQPDVYIYLQLSVEEGLDRVGRRAEDDTRFDKEKLSFHRRVKKGYDELAAARDNCFVVDGGQSVQEVADDVWEITSQILNN